MKIIHKLTIIFSILLLGLATSFMISKTSYDHQNADLKIQEQLLVDNFAQKISTEKDAYKLASSALRQIKSNLPSLAILSIARAVSVEPNYRDGWLTKSLIELQTSNTAAALESAKKAEALNPINPKTYEILTEIYTQIDNQPLAQAAQTKLDFLLKK